MSIPSFFRAHKRGLLIAAIILAVGAMALAVNKLILAHRVARELAAIRARGEPTTLEELNSWYPTPPAGENAADVYAQAVSSYNGDAATISKLPWALNSESLPPPGDALPAEVKAQMQQLLAAHAESLALLHKATAMPQCRFQVDFSKAFEVTSAGAVLDVAGWYDDPVGLLVQDPAFKLLEAEALVSADEYDAPKAASSISAMMGMAEHFSQEPLLGAVATSTIQQMAATCCLERALSRTSLPGDDLKRLDLAIARALASPKLPRAVMAQRCMISSAFTDQAVGERLIRLTRLTSASTRLAGPESFARFVRLFRPTSGADDREHLRYLAMMDDCIAQTNQESVAEGRLKLELHYEGPPDNALGNLFWRQDNLFILWHLLQQPLLTGNLSTSTVKLRLAQIAVAIERYRADQNALPKSLDDLVPRYLTTIPVSPTDGNRFQYRMEAKGYSLYAREFSPGAANGSDEHNPFYTFHVTR